MKNKNHMILVWSHQKHRPASVSLSSLDAGSSFFIFFLQESNSADKVQLTINVSRQVVHHWPRLTCFNVEHHLCVCVWTKHKCYDLTHQHSYINTLSTEF